MWVLDHLDDLESDLSRFHRVDDLHALDGPRFFRLAARVFAYGGVMAARLREQEGDIDGAGPQAGAQRQREVSLNELAGTHKGWIERTVTKA